MYRCKYAKDINDIDCKDCNGIVMFVEGVEYSCASCPSYEPSREDVQIEEKEESKLPVLYKVIGAVVIIMLLAWGICFFSSIEDYKQENPNDVKNMLSDYKENDEEPTAKEGTGSNEKMEEHTSEIEDDDEVVVATFEAGHVMTDREIGINRELSSEEKENEEHIRKALLYYAGLIGKVDFIYDGYERIDELSEYIYVVDEEEELRIPICVETINGDISSIRVISSGVEDLDED